MAKNWIEAQKNEKIFWENIFVNQEQDIVYKKPSKNDWVSFALQILSRHSLELNQIKNKKIIDIGSGPGGIVMGLKELIGKNQNSKLICADPLMDFFSEKIGLFKKDKNIVLLNCKGEDLPLDNESVDIVFCTNVLDHCENPEKVILESYRVLKKGGFFLPSLHLVFDYLFFVKKYIKFFDTNHPNHFTEKDILYILQKTFSKSHTTKKIKIIEDQTKFTFLNIFKNKSIIRGLKRFLSNYILYTCYFYCEK